MDTELSLTAVQGGLAALQCHTTARAQIALIIWYRSNSEVPIYTIDLRAAGAHKHTSNTSRLRFDLERRTLYVHNVSRALDQGSFRCRVDYKKHRSENTFVDLKVTGKFGFKILFKLIFKLKNYRWLVFLIRNFRMFGILGNFLTFWLRIRFTAFNCSEYIRREPLKFLWPSELQRL